MASYDRLAGDYDRRWAAYNARSLALLRPFVAGAELGDVLDLACGTANLLPRLDAWGVAVRSYTGVDASREMLRAARSRPAVSAIPATLQAADAAKLPFGAASFDTVVCASALHEFPEPERAVAPETPFVPDNKLTFSKVDAVFKAGNQTRDDIPSHLIVGKDVTGDVADFYSHVCPAGVYERQGDRLVVNAPNCIDCKATDVVGPRWTPREGGSGPAYKRM